MLRIAVPNKGMLSEPAWNMLAEAGYRLRTNPRQLVVQDPDNGIELFYLRPLDIAVYVGRGAIDVGITGQDLLKNSGTAALEHMPLGFGASTFRFAAPNESPITTLEDVQGKRVATTFDKLVHDYLVEHGIQAETIHLDGAVESSVQLGVADALHYTGPLDAAAMRQAYLEADVFLLPSSCENSPNSLGEAMLLGMPCVASNAGGIPDMLAAGREGLLYGESQDADALARCLLQVLTAPDGGTALGQAARARALHTHDAAANAAALVGIYETILKGDAQ